MIYCPKHITRPVLDRCPDCEMLRERERQRRRSARMQRILLALLGPFRVVWAWLCTFRGDIAGPTGYRVVIGVPVTLFTLYAATYAIVEARYERRMNRALYERAVFMDMVTSGKPTNFVIAMKDFGRIQTLVAREPHFGNPVQWFAADDRDPHHQPNREPLWRWAFYFLDACTPEICATAKIKAGICQNPQAGGDAKLGRIDLRGIDLRGTDLHWAKLKRALLHGVKLHGADLHGADLQEADLQGADLHGVKLLGADLHGAYLPGADLQGADLRVASLREACLIGVNLQGADLQGADLRRVRLDLLQDWTQIRSIKEANIYGIHNAPVGFIEWAKNQGAVEIQDDDAWHIFLFKRARRNKDQRN